MEFVREALGEDIKLPDSTTEPSTPANSGANSSWYSQRRNDTFFTKTRSKKSIANCVTINVNYHFTGVTTIGETQQPTNTTTALAIKAASPTNKNNLNASDLECTQLSCASPLNNANIASFNYDWSSKTLERILEPNQSGTSLKSTNPQCLSEQSETKVKSARRKLHLAAQFKPAHSKNTHSRPFRCARQTFSLHKKNKHQLQQRFSCLLNCYRNNLKRKELLYKRVPVLRTVYKYCKALELYTNLLRDLKMTCRNAFATTSGAATTSNSQTISTPTTASTQQLPSAKFFVHSSQQYFGKRARVEEESNVCLRSKKASRQEENFKHMLLPDTAEDANRKDASMYSIKCIY